jgi:hypothetical protein
MPATMMSTPNISIPLPPCGGLIDNRFESLKGDRIIHIGVSGNTSPDHEQLSQSSQARLSAKRYFASTLDVMEVITLDAMLN